MNILQYWKWVVYPIGFILTFNVSLVAISTWYELHHKWRERRELQKLLKQMPDTVPEEWIKENH